MIREPECNPYFDRPPASSSQTNAAQVRLEGDLENLREALAADPCHADISPPIMPGRRLRDLAREVFIAERLLADEVSTLRIDGSIEDEAAVLAPEFIGFTSEIRAEDDQIISLWRP